jgi:hypothetical protein
MTSRFILEALKSNGGGHLWSIGRSAFSFTAVCTAPTTSALGEAWSALGPDGAIVVDDIDCNVASNYSRRILPAIKAAAREKTGRA